MATITSSTINNVQWGNLSQGYYESLSFNWVLDASESPLTLTIDLVDSNGNTIAGDLYSPQELEFTGENTYHITLTSADDGLSVSEMYAGDVLLAVYDNGSLVTFAAGASNNLGALPNDTPKTATIAQWRDLASRVKNPTIADSSITVAKFANGAVNEAIITTNNLAPSSDTVTAWRSLYPNSGYYITYFNAANSFTHQPTQYGFLETIFRKGNNSLYQRWTTHIDVPDVYYRVGDNNTWYGGATASGDFTKGINKNVLYTKREGTSISANSNLNTITFCQPGKFYCSSNATVATLSNCPTTSAFIMEVININGEAMNATSSTTQMYLTRIITTIGGKMWAQGATVGSTAGSWSFTSWKPLDEDITVTSTDPGEGSALAAGQFIAVY